MTTLILVHLSFWRIRHLNSGCCFFEYEGEIKSIEYHKYSIFNLQSSIFTPLAYPFDILHEFNLSDRRQNLFQVVGILDANRKIAVDHLVLTGF